MTLANDVARCAGHTKMTPNGIAYRKDCKTCERRLAGAGPKLAAIAQWMVWMEAPNEFPCPMEIKAEHRG